MTEDHAEYLANQLCEAVLETVTDHDVEIVLAALISALLNVIEQASPDEETGRQVVKNLSEELVETWRSAMDYQKYNGRIN